MARRAIQLTTGNIYHIMSRGNAKQEIFFQPTDNFRFTRDLYEFNDENVIDTRYRDMLRCQAKLSGLSGSDPDNFGRRIRNFRKRESLVEVLVFCLMPNHFHLLLRQLKDGGISEFVKKIKGGYAAYVNKKYNRTGSLFQSHFKAITIENDFQLNTIFAYIHTNPCQLVEPGWKTTGLKNEERALATLDDYRWSSFYDYVGRKNFPSLTNRKMFTEIYGGPNGCEQAVKDWVRHKSDSYENIKDFVLE